MGISIAVMAGDQPVSLAAQNADADGWHPLAEPSGFEQLIEVRGGTRWGPGLEVRPRGFTGAEDPAFVNGDQAFRMAYFRALARLDASIGFLSQESLQHFEGSITGTLPGMEPGQTIVADEMGQRRVDADAETQVRNQEFLKKQDQYLEGGPTGQFVEHPEYQQYENPAPVSTSTGKTYSQFTVEELAKFPAWYREYIRLMELAVVGGPGSENAEAKARELLAANSGTQASGDQPAVTSGKTVIPSRIAASDNQGNVDGGSDVDGNAAGDGERSSAGDASTGGGFSLDRSDMMLLALAVAIAFFVLKKKGK